MIDIKELRVGNLIMLAAEDGVGGMDILKEHEVTSSTLAWMEREIVMTEPIPLTEEWLEKFGFKKETNTISPTAYFFILNGHFEIGYTTREGFVFNSKDFNSFIEVKHVHQLQNLYFALTGEEL